MKNVRSPRGGFFFDSHCIYKMANAAQNVAALLALALYMHVACDIA